MQMPLVEITLYSLKGVALVGGSLTKAPNRVPNITAAVAFSGSASDMQVTSSFVCPKTGNLMVESHAATTLPRTKEQNHQPMIACWSECGDSGVQYLKDNQPHVSIHLPHQTSRLPAVSIACSNRDSNIVQKIASGIAPSMDSSEISTSTNAELEEGRGGSIIWTQSEAAMPDIIELNVSLKVDTDYLNQPKNENLIIMETPSLLDLTDSWDEEEKYAQSIYEVGIAYLVLFGNDPGTTVMDLPIKNLNQHFPGNVIVDSSATLRIRVDVYPTGTKHGNRSNMLLSPWEAMHQLHDPRVFEPILRQLQLVDEMRATRKDKENKVAPKTKAGAFCGVLDLFWSGCSDSGEDFILEHTNTTESTFDSASKDLL